MDSFEINKIIAAILLTALIVIGIGKFTDVLFHVDKPKQSAYKIEGLESAVASTSSNSKMKIVEIFKKKGEIFFRIQEEKEVLESLKKNKTVIALGGGAFLKKSVREKILKNSLSIWLDINLKTLNKRLKWNKKRPLLSGENSQIIIKKLFAQRKSIYKLANHKINCNNLSKEDIIKKIIDLYEKQ